MLNSVGEAPNDTEYMWWSCHNGLANPMQIVSTPPAPSNGGSITVFLASRPCGPAGWLAMLLINADDVETNPGPTTTCKQVWICDIYHRQIHVRKQISIRCTRNEHWVHLRCAGIRLAQYTDTWACHQHREYRLTTHTDITPPHPPRPWPKPATHSPPTPPQPKHKTHIPLPPFSSGIDKAQTQSCHRLGPNTPRPESNTYPCHTLHLHLSPHSSLAHLMH